MTRAAACSMKVRLIPTAHGVCPSWLIADKVICSSRSRYASCIWWTLLTLRNAALVPLDMTSAEWLPKASAFWLCYRVKRSCCSSSHHTGVMNSATNRNRSATGTLRRAPHLESQTESANQPRMVKRNSGEENGTKNKNFTLGELEKQFDVSGRNK